MRPPGSAQQLEKRRLRAITLLESGTSYRTVASAVGASLSNIVRWAEVYDKEGSEGLKSRPIPGRPSQLTEAQQKKLKKILLKGPLKDAVPRQRTKLMLENNEELGMELPKARA